MAYVGPYWQNKPSTASPINATNLKIMDGGITQNDFENSKRHAETDNFGMRLLENKYINIIGNVDNAQNRFCSEFIPCPPNVSVTYAGENNHQGICGLAFYRKDFVFISGSANTGTPKGTPTTVTSPANTAYCRLSTDKDVINAGSYVRIDNSQYKPIVWLNRRIDGALDKIDVEKDDVISKISVTDMKACADMDVTMLLQRSNLTEGYYYLLPSTTPIADSNSVYTPSPIDVSNYIGKKIGIVVNNNSAGGRTFGFLNSDDTVKSIYNKDSKHYETNGYYVYYADITAPKFVFSWTKIPFIKIFICESESASIEELENVENEIDKIERFVGIKSSVYQFDLVNAGVFVTSGVRATFANQDASLVTSITVGDPPTGYGFAIYYDNSSTTWQYEEATYVKPNDSLSTWHVVFRRSDNGNITDSDLQAIINGFTITVKTQKIESGGTCYVATNGSDSNTGSESQPFATVAKALSVCNHVLIKPGTYTEVLNVSSMNNISICAATNRQNTDEVIFDYNNTKQVGFNFENVIGLNISNIKIANTTGNVCNIHNCSDVLVQQCKFTGGGSEGLSLDGSNAVIIDCDAYDNDNDGFNIHGYGDTVFYNCNGYNNGGDGISHHNACTGYVSGGYWHDNTKAGIATPTYGAKVNISNAFVYNNQFGMQVYGDTYVVENSVRIKIDNCVFKDNTYGIQVNKYAVDLINCIFTGNTQDQLIESGSATEYKVN